jgi:hypothetical protein
MYTFGYTFIFVFGLSLFLLSRSDNHATVGPFGEVRKAYRPSVITWLIRLLVQVMAVLMMAFGGLGLFLQIVLLP